MTGVVQAFQRMRWGDRLFVPLALLIGFSRIVDGLQGGPVWSLSAGAGFGCYASGRLWQYMHEEGDAMPRGPMGLQMAGVGLWLASLIWRFASE